MIPFSAFHSPIHTLCHVTSTARNNAAQYFLIVSSRPCHFWLHYVCSLKTGSFYHRPDHWKQKSHMRQDQVSTVDALAREFLALPKYVLWISAMSQYDEHCLGEESMS